MQLGQSRGEALASHQYGEERLLGMLLVYAHDGCGDVLGLNSERRHEGRDRRVHVGVVEYALQGELVVLSARTRNQVDRVLDARLLGKARAQAVLRFGSQVDHVEPVGLACVGRHDAGPAGVRHDGHAVAGRQRLVGERHREVEQVFDGLGPEGSGLIDEGLGDELGAGQGSRVGGCGARPGSGSPGFHDADRLALCYLAPQLHESLRVAETLQVHQHDLDARVVAPVLDDVVAADFGLVAARDEHRDADV